jgi:hypothetical protein
MTVEPPDLDLRAAEEEPQSVPADDGPANDGPADQPPEVEQKSAAPVEAVISPGPEQDSATQPAEEVMDDRPTSGPAPSSDNDLEGAARRRSPPAVILAAKAARDAARNTIPDASAEALREAARNAARAAAMGNTQNHTAPAHATETVPAAEAETLPASVPEPQEQVAEPTETPQYIEPAAPAHPPTGPDYSAEPSPVPFANLGRLEDIAEQILMELRHQNSAASDFSVSKLMAGITMVISLALLVYAYLYKDNATTLQSLLQLGLMLQTITISLLIMGRQK